ncbi:NupC/NupG family nucleoside CNT transporter [Salmonella enterica]|uniref:NupC/NupG family nucleoside CNT transporter n=1 Tax=Salmonella enterica subsp. salamae serovar 48:d:z6 TaxID=1151170 RepID=A0A729PYS0_SALER|nr:NupC/NupG family nucleoside CNT transporter [Salmonella enterica]MFX13584.1 NupC/NupG family nucleoside CNT transporter [Salmonella enterica]HAC6544074.1 NupC/NupG family nucleoside CNT transporter [Salmonella enterica subsp. salamae serovar 48:d:z6]HAE3251937.1 NupC/NupG family nucleoside CNT transporter [Salmonella enterica subsp. salamae serovar 48:d:z6]HAE7840115.1 NupC/NupG family nucleoside CNT transporter [Salmonella enterica subsp. salamae serovar 48:d:z6]
MKYFIAALSLVSIFIMAWFVSYNRRGITKKIPPIICCLLTEFIMAFVLTRTRAGIAVMNMLSEGFHTLFMYADAGTYFVFGDLVNKGGSNFLLEALMPTVFICALIGILKYIKLLPFLIKYTGAGLNRITKVGGLESYGAVSAVVMGMSAVFVAIKENLDSLEKKRLYTLSAASISSVDLSIVAAYMKMIDGKYVMLAIILNFFSYFIIVSIINPYDSDDYTFAVAERKVNFFAVLTEHIWDGFRIVSMVAAMVVGFVALIAMLNGIFFVISGVSFQIAVGYLFSPFAFLTGIPWHDSMHIGEIMATKLLANEFVAMLELSRLLPGLSPRTAGVISVFLVSYANFGSVGILVGVVNSLSTRQGRIVAGFSMKLLYGASLVSLLSATITGVML